MFDLIIRGGRRVDGSGAPPRSGDIAIEDGRIALIGQIDGPAKREIAAQGRVVKWLPGPHLTPTGASAQHCRMIRPATWTIYQVSGAGCAAGLAALILWPVYAAWPEIIRFPFIAALAVAAACGIVMLWMTARDMRMRSGRGSRLRPIRAFDVILGLVLSVPCLIELRAIMPEGLAQLGL